MLQEHRGKRHAFRDWWTWLFGGMSTGRGERIVAWLKIRWQSRASAGTICLRGRPTRIDPLFKGAGVDE